LVRKNIVQEAIMCRLICGLVATLVKNLDFFNCAFTIVQIPPK